MSEEQIEEIYNCESYIEAIKKIVTIYPNGFDINKVDKRVKKKLDELTDKYCSIQKPIQVRKEEQNEV